MNIPSWLVWLGATGAATFLIVWAITKTIRLSAAWQHFLWSVALTVPLFILPLTTLAPRFEFQVLPPLSEDITQTSPSAEIAIEPAATLEVSPMEMQGASQGKPATVLSWWLFIWGTGAAAVLGIFLISHCRVWLVTRRKFLEPTTAIRRTLEEIKVHFPVDVRLGISDSSSVPFCAGLLRPRIIIPSSASAWSSETTKMCLAHEMAHLWRGDLLWLALAQVACAVSWFNPFTWWGLRRMRETAESAADDLVLIRCGDAPAYAECLLGIAEQAGSTAHLAAYPMARPGQLANRITGILDAGRNRRPAPLLGRLTVAFVCLLLLGALFSVKLVAAEASETTPAKPPSDGNPEEPVTLTGDGNTFMKDGKAEVNENASLKFMGIEAKADRVIYSPDGRTAQLFRKAKSSNDYDLVATLVLQGSESGIYDFAQQYIDAVNRKDAQAIRKLLYTEALDGFPPAEREQIITSWVKAEIDSGPVAKESELRVSPWDLDKIVIKPPYYLPATPTYVLRFNEGGRGRVLAVVARSKKFGIVQLVSSPKQSEAAPGSSDATSKEKDSITITLQNQRDTPEQVVKVPIGTLIASSSANEAKIASAFAAASRIEPNHRQYRSGDNAAYLQIDIRYRGQHVQLSTYHPIYEYSGNLVGTPKLLQPLQGKTLADAVAEQPEFYRNFRKTFDAIYRDVVGSTFTPGQALAKRDVVE